MPVNLIEPRSRICKIFTRISKLLAKIAKDPNQGPVKILDEPYKYDP